MKNANLLLIVFLIAFISCNNRLPDEGSGDEPVSGNITIIKMDKDMQEKILVSPIIRSVYMNEKYNNQINYDENLLSLSNVVNNGEFLSFVDEHFNIVGTSPYIPLSNDYVMVTWRWRDFHPIATSYLKASDGSSCTNHIVRLTDGEQFYLLNNKWKELADLQTQWNKSDGQIINSIEIKRILINKLDKYRSTSSGISKLGELTFTIKGAWFAYRYENGSIDAVNRYVAQCDSLESIYIETIKEIIEKDDWKEVE